jgi:hypothetical protein
VEFRGGIARATAASVMSGRFVSGRLAGAVRDERGAFIEDPAIMTVRILLAT